MLYLSPSYILVELKVGHSFLSLLSVNVLVAELRQLGGMLDDSIDLFLGLSNLPNLLSARLIILNSSAGQHFRHLLDYRLLKFLFCEVITAFSTAFIRAPLDWIDFFEMVTEGLFYINSSELFQLINFNINGR